MYVWTVVIAAVALFGAAHPAASRVQGLDTGTGAAQVHPENDMTVLNVASRSDEFQNWVARFRSVALRRGISAATYSAAFRNVEFNTDVIQKDRNQAEFSKTIWEYLDLVASDQRIRDGKTALRRNAKMLDAIEKHYGVDKEIIVSVWGMESAYGEKRGDFSVIEALATLAFDGRRRRFFEGELVSALRILQAGDVSTNNMLGSWAGAMGHTQFIPSSFLAYAVDANGDGRRDIWAENPVDALASTAAYLARFGWRTGHPWGVEVQLPAGFDFSLAGRNSKRSIGDWSNNGLRLAGGDDLPDFGSASLLLPAGAGGPAFLVFHNFGVIERYNRADAYVIGVGHLADRIKGKPPIHAKWPRKYKALTKAEIQNLQQRLTRAGFDTFGSDGLMGPNTISAIKAFQLHKGLPPDGYPTQKLLRTIPK